MAQYKTDFDTLVALIKDYVEDDSQELQDMIKGAINRAEERLFRDLDLVIWNTPATGQTSNGTASVSKGFTDTHVHAILFDANGDYAQRRTLEFVYMLSPNRSLGTGQPLYYAEDDVNVYFAPVADSDYNYTILYAKRPTPLASGANSQNWFTSNAGDALLWASLVECEGFLVAPDRVQEFESKYQQMLGPLRGVWRHVSQKSYEPMDPTPAPRQTR